MILAFVMFYLIGLNSRTVAEVIQTNLYKFTKFDVD